MALHGKSQLWSGNAAAVIGHTDALDAALDQLNLYFGRPRVEAVFQQFLERCGRPLHHFTGGNLVDQQLGQDLDGGAHHPILAALWPAPPQRRSGKFIP